MAITNLKEITCNHFRHCKTVADWHCNFKHCNKLLPNPNDRVKDRLPPFLSNNTDAIEAIKLFCTDNINDLIAERVCDYSCESVLVALLENRRKELNDKSITKENVLNENSINCDMMNKLLHHYFVKHIRHKTKIILEKKLKTH